MFYCRHLFDVVAIIASLLSRRVANINFPAYFVAPSLQATVKVEISCIKGSSQYLCNLMKASNRNKYFL